MRPRRKPARTGRARRAAAIAVPAAAECAHSPLVLAGCEVLERFEERGDCDLRCRGHDGVAVFASGAARRISSHFGSARSLSFSTRSTPGDTTGWVSDAAGVVAAMARSFSCNQDRIAIVAGANSPVRGVSR